MNQALIEDDQQQGCCSRCGFNCLLAIKIGLLVALTYGLMVLVFWVCLLIEQINGPIPDGYQKGGAIILAIFGVNVVFWGALWCWGAQKREDMRRAVVQRQLGIIKKEEDEQERADLEDERRIIEQRRRMQA